MPQWRRILTGVILSLVLCTGCLSSPPAGPASPVPVVSSAPTTPLPPSLAVPPVTPATPVQEAQPSRFDIVHLALHNITVFSPGQKSGRASRLAVLDISLRHDGARAYSLNNGSLVSIERYKGGEYFLYPDTGYFYKTSENPLLPCTLFPGQEKRGTVIYQVLEGVDSMVLYVRDRNWTIAGELFIPDISKGSLGSSGTEYPKYLGMIVHSATQYRTLLGMGPLASGHRFAVINVSITNHGTADVGIPREHLFILTEKDMTYEHGGERETPEVARLFLRFPLVIHPGETKCGSILYIVSPTTRINKLILTDRNFVINSITDLNGIYRYE
jgi:hypothetical protein